MLDTKSSETKHRLATNLWFYTTDHKWLICRRALLYGAYATLNWLMVGLTVARVWRGRGRRVKHCPKGIKYKDHDGSQF